MKTRKPKIVDHVANAYKTVRDATVCNESLSVSEKLGTLELIRAEILDDALNDLRRGAMNE